jgi:hypothetical protein
VNYSPSSLPAGLGDPSPGSLAASARASVLIADFANIDGGGKLNVVGGAFQLVGRAPFVPGMPLGIGAMTVVAIIDVDYAHAGEQFSVVLTLKNSANEPVQVPGPVEGQTQALRISQVATATAGDQVPKDAHLPIRCQVVANIGPGMPLEPSSQYYWELQVDGHSDRNWRAVFYVRADQTGPVLG